MPLRGLGCGAREGLGAACLLMAAFPPLPSPHPASRRIANWGQRCFLSPHVAAAALQPRLCGGAHGGEDVSDTALAGRGAGGQPWQAHPVPPVQRQLTAPAIAPADGDRVETVAGGGYRDQGHMTRGAASAVLPMSAKAVTGATMNEE